MGKTFSEIIKSTSGKTFAEIMKFNPYHGSDGRFTTAGAAASFTYRPGASNAHNNAIEREKERTAAASQKINDFDEEVLELPWTSTRSVASEAKVPKAKFSESKPKENQEQIDRVKRFEDDLIAELKRDIKPEYRDMFNTVHDLLHDDNMEADIRRVKAAVESNDKSEMARLKTSFTKESEEYARPWYDEDLGRYRSGYKWESDFYRKLADLCEPKAVAKSFSEMIEIEKFNPYHDSRGRFASASGGASGLTFSANPDTKAGQMAIERRNRQNRVYGATNTKDVLDEINSGKHNSLEKYLDKNGNLTPEREAVHKQIIDDLLNGKIPVKGQATMTMLGGGPASGKSSVMNPDTSKDRNAVTVDPDDIKKRLPGFKEMAEKSPNAAAFYHEESSALAKRFSEVAYSENYNVVYDGTGDGSVNSVMKKINGAKEKGYRVEAKYVSIDTEEALRRNQKRYDDAVAKGETPRLPPADMVAKTHAKCTDISVSLAPEFDHIEIWDNNGARGQQKLMATGGSGKYLTATDKPAFERYLKKSVSGLEGFKTLPDGQVAPAN